MFSRFFSYVGVWLAVRFGRMVLGNVVPIAVQLERHAKTPLHTYVSCVLCIGTVGGENKSEGAADSAVSWAFVLSNATCVVCLISRN